MNHDRPFPLREQRMGFGQRRPNLGKPWRNLSIAVVPIALLAVAFGLTSRTSSKPAEVAPVQRSDDTAKRGDKLHVDHVPPLVVQVRTIPIVQPLPEPPPLPVPPRVAAAADPDVWPVLTDDEKRVRKPARGRGDICQKHGLRKVMVSGGKSWRCRR